MNLHKENINTYYHFSHTQLEWSNILRRVFVNYQTINIYLHTYLQTINNNHLIDMFAHFNYMKSHFQSSTGTIPWYSRQPERLNNMPAMGSNLEWTVTP